MITMKTKLHKLASLLLAFALTLCLALPAGAVGEETTPLSIVQNQTGNIKVDGIIEPADTSVTVNVYRLMTVNFDTTNQQPVEPVYTWVEPVASWLEKNESYQKYIKAEDNSVTSEFSTPSGDENAQNTKSAEIAGFYDALAAAIRSGGANGVTLNPANTPGTIATNGSCTIENLEMGNYLVLIEGGMKVYRPSAVNLVPVWKEATGAGETSEWVLSDAEVELKSSDLTLTKQVYDGTITTGVIPAWGETAQVAIGDTVTYQLIADLPEFPENAINKGYQISDTLPEGMTLNNNSFTVYGMTSKEDANPTQLTSKQTADADEGAYYVATTNATRPVDADNDNHRDSVSFNIAFDYDNLKNTTEGAETRYTYVKVTYTATANENIKVYGDSLGDGKGTSTGNENTAYLDYNNNPYESVAEGGSPKWETAQDTATVFTYGMEITKTDDAQQPNRLTGAEFTLQKADNDGNATGSALTFVEIGTGSGTYRLAKSGETPANTLVVGGDNADTMKGVLKISGLDVGTYILTETKAPGGYVKPAQPFTITIEDDKTVGDENNSTPNGKVEFTQNKTESETDGYVRQTIPNTQGFTLPTTGGMGTVLFTAGGVLLMGAGLVVLVLFLRRRTSR